MPIVHWSPFQEIESLQHEMNRLFETLSPSIDRKANGSVSRVDFLPAVELKTTPDAVVLRVELPGFDPKAINVEVASEAVLISGDRPSEIKPNEHTMTRSEFRYGAFYRVVPLPTRVQQSEVQADYKDGILTLRLPKLESEKNRVVKVSLS